jgi:hypothetical protein
MVLIELGLSAAWRKAATAEHVEQGELSMSNTEKLSESWA